MQQISSMARDFQLGNQWKALMKDQDLIVGYYDRLDLKDWVRVQLRTKGVEF